jgi:hypothetical protein
MWDLRLEVDGPLTFEVFFSTQVRICKFMNAYWYYLIEPILSGYVESSYGDAIASIEVNFPDSKYQVSLFGKDSALHFIRIKIPGAYADMPKEMSETISKRVQLVKEHCISILRILYEKDISLHPMNLWQFIDDGKTPNLSINFEHRLNTDWVFPGELFINVFQNTFNCREELKLLADSLDERIPLQYRYLSLYKILEIHFFNGTKPKKELSIFLAKYENDFKNQFNRSISLKGYTINLRARCAHIKSDNNVLGITMLNNKDAHEVDGFLPFMYQIAKEVLNSHPENKGFRIE